MLTFVKFYNEHIWCVKQIQLKSWKDDFKYIYNVHLGIGNRPDLLWDFPNHQLAYTSASRVSGIIFQSAHWKSIAFLSDSQLYNS